jgi:hypothetical protein
MLIRIYDIAKKFGLDNKVVIAKAKALGIVAARVASSILDDATGKRLEAALRGELVEDLRSGLQSMSLGNFKAFADTQSVPIRPLTLVFGANSSGKSSIIHGLLLARHAVETGKIDVARTELGGESVDLGGFRQYVHRRDAGRRVEFAAEINTDTLRGAGARLLRKNKAVKITLSFGMPLDDVGKPKPGEVPRLISYEVEAGGRSILRLSRRPEETMQLDRLDESVIQPIIDAIVLNNTTAERLGAENETASVKDAMQGLIPTLRFTCQRLLPDRLVGEEYSVGGPHQLLPVGRGTRTEDLVNAARLFVPRTIADIIASINTSVQTQLERVAYLGPLRSFPPRHLAFAEDTDPNWYAGGGYAWDVVRRDEKVRGAVNAWLGSADRLRTPYELALERLFTASDAQAAVESGLGGIAADMEQKRRAEGISEEDYHFPFDNLWDEAEYARRLVQDIRKQSDQNPTDELVLIDRRTNTSVTHRDVGIGVSQVLPVLVHAYADKGRIVAIEQPEIHLHPALQAELGDVFIESALGERQNTFLLETHSEHLILRILRRVRETTEKRLPEGATPVRPEDITVVFVEPTAKGSVVRHLPVTPDGDFSTPWPGGFFADRLADLP